MYIGTFLILISFVGLSLESCPYIHDAYSKAIDEQKISLDRKNQLISFGFTVSKGQPGYTFYLEDNITHIDLLHKVDRLYVAIQLYDQFNLMKNGGPNLYSIENKLQNLASISNCLPLEDRCRIFNETITFEQLRYRTIDGKFNNLKNPLYGASYVASQRYIDPVYNDGINTIRRNAINGGELPSARIIGNEIFQNYENEINPKNVLTTLGLYFGQNSGAHDLGQLMKTATKEGEDGLLCCSKDYTEILPKKFQYDGCLPIDIPKDDPFYSSYNMTCQNFIRTYKAFSDDCLLGYAHPMNRHTSFLDNSVLYGATDEISKTLRTFSNGKMKTNAENVLPEDPSSNQFLYLLADSRSQLTPVLSLILSLFLRLHNNLATELSAINTHWNDETLFQEARRIGIALYQHLFYTEYIPLILGEDYALKKGLICKNQLFCGQYNPTINSDTHTDHTEAAFRLFHSNIAETLDLYDLNFNLYRNNSISDYINVPNILQTDYLGVLRGVLMQHVKLNGYNPQARTTFFKNYNSLGVGIDLSSIDIQRGRDHGLAPYYKYMEYCQPHLGNISKWSDLKTNIPEKDINKLKQVYHSVFDVDLYVGLYLERKSEYFGPVSVCIMGNQFYKSKFGDRFFYSFKGGHNPLSEDQLKEIHQYSFGQFLCQQSDLEKVTKNPLVIPSEMNSFINCSTFRKFNISLWSESVDITKLATHGPNSKS